MDMPCHHAVGLSTALAILFICSVPWRMGVIPAHEELWRYYTTDYWYTHKQSLNRKKLINAEVRV